MQSVAAPNNALMYHFTKEIWVTLTVYLVSHHQTRDLGSVLSQFFVPNWKVLICDFSLDIKHLTRKKIIITIFLVVVIFQTLWKCNKYFRRTIIQKITKSLARSNFFFIHLFLLNDQFKKYVVVILCTVWFMLVLWNDLFSYHNTGMSFMVVWGVHASKTFLSCSIPEICGAHKQVFLSLVSWKPQCHYFGGKKRTTNP